MEYELLPLSWAEVDASPPLEPGEEAVRLAVNAMRYTADLVEFEFHASYFVPEEVADRYHDFQEAFVLVVNDVDQQDGAAIRMRNEFIDFPDEEPSPANLITPPPLPLARRGDITAQFHRGGWVNGAMSFRSPRPIHRPSVFLHLVFENYVSNSIGFDLVGKKIVEYR